MPSSAAYSTAQTAITRMEPEVHAISIARCSGRIQTTASAVHSSTVQSQSSSAFATPVRALSRHGSSSAHPSGPRGSPCSTLPTGDRAADYAGHSLSSKRRFPPASRGLHRRAHVSRSDDPAPADPAPSSDSGDPVDYHQVQPSINVVDVLLRFVVGGVRRRVRLDDALSCWNPSVLGTRGSGA